MNNIVGIINSTIEECSDKKIKELLEIINYKPKKNKIFLKPNGNCAKKFAKKHNFPWILGCPPDYHEMIKFLLEEVN